MSGVRQAGSHLEVVALPTSHRFRAGDDLISPLLEAMDQAGRVLQDGDVLCVASKVVSLVEGQIVSWPEGIDDPREGRRHLAAQQATDIVADTARALVTRTPQGFVAANGGIDGSNLEGGDALLLPEDPDRSAAALRDALGARTGRQVGIIVTDTFGRPWRTGQTDVALGVAGVAALRDERGEVDLDGRSLEVTQVAVADEIAAAADLTRTKASGTPFVLVRGVAAGVTGRGRDLIRPLEEDLFPAGGPTAAERAVAGRRTIRRFTEEPVPEAALHAAVTAAATAPAPHHTRPWRFLRLLGRARDHLLDEMAARWRSDLEGDGVDAEVIARRLTASDRVLRAAPELLAAFVVLEGAHTYPDARRSTAERDLFMLSGGAALANLQVVLAAHGLGAAWISSTTFCAPTVRQVLGVDQRWEPLGMVAIGRPAEPPRPRPTTDASDLLIDVENLPSGV